MAMDYCKASSLQFNWNGFDLKKGNLHRRRHPVVEIQVSSKGISVQKIREIQQDKRSKLGKDQ